MAPDTQSINLNATFPTSGLALSHPFDNPIDDPEYVESETLSAAIKRVDLDDDEDDVDEEEDEDDFNEDDEEDDEEEFDDQDEDEEDDDDLDDEFDDDEEDHDDEDEDDIKLI